MCLSHVSPTAVLQTLSACHEAKHPPYNNVSYQVGWEPVSIHDPINETAASSHSMMMIMMKQQPGSTGNGVYP
jgi:hypothetical protein